MNHGVFAFVAVVLLVVVPIVPMSLAGPAPCQGVDPVVDTQVPQVVARDGTPVVARVVLAECAWESYNEVRAWLGNATHQVSRVYDGSGWVTSQYFVDLDGMAVEEGALFVALQANPGSVHAGNLIDGVGSTMMWLRLRGPDGAASAVPLGLLDWVDEDRVMPYWGDPDDAWLPVRSPHGSLLGSTLSGLDRDGRFLAQGFGHVALPTGAPASPDPPVSPGDVMVVRAAPRLHGGGSGFELWVGEGIEDLRGVRIMGRSGELVLPELEVLQGSLVWVTDAPDTAIAALSDQVPGHFHPDPVVVTWNAPPADGGGAADVIGRFQIARSGGSLSVMYGDVVLDSFAYGDAPAPTSWWGPSVEATRIDGRVFLREWSPEGFVDTDTADDWQRPRVHRQHTVDLPTRWFDVEGPVRAWVCPDRCHEEPLMRVEAARESIDVNLYELTLASVVEALASATQRGVEVRVLVHESPVAASSTRMDRVAWAVDRLVEAGAQVRTLEGLRYDVNHAKYLIVDGMWTVVTTENAVQRGWPPNGVSGNRGHGVAVHDEDLATWTSSLFELDFMHPVDARDITGTDLHPDAQPVRQPTEALFPPPAVQDRLETLVVEGPFPVAPVLAPDHMGDPRRNPIVERIEEARALVGLAQMNLPLEWNRPGHQEESPFALALLESAERGVNVYGTLAGAFVDPERDGNHRTAAVLHVASNETVDLRLGGAPHPDGVVHAKTWWMDPGTPYGVAITGSANGNLASQALNRELNLVLAHPTIAAYWHAVAQGDLERAAGFREYAPDPIPARGTVTQPEDDTEAEEAGTAWAGAVALGLLTTSLLLALQRRRTARSASPPSDHL